MGRTAGQRLTAHAQSKVKGLLRAATRSTRRDQRIADGAGVAFKPAGRVFREWLAVDDADRRKWRGLLDEARTLFSHNEGAVRIRSSTLS